MEPFFNPGFIINPHFYMVLNLLPETTKALALRREKKE
jgi:hypothetical protein